MACKDDEGGSVTLTWEIQNFGLFLSLEEGTYYSPFWKTEHNGTSVWRRFHIQLTDSDMYFGLSPAAECLQIDRCEISLISSCTEIPLKPHCRDSGYRSYTVGRDAVFGEKRQSTFPSDTLTLRYKMWEKTMNPRAFRINSVFHRFSYLWSIENFCPNNDYSKCIEEENFLFKAILKSKSKKGNHNFLLYDASFMEHCVSLVDCKLYDKNGSACVIREMNDNTCNTKIYEIEISRYYTRLDLQLESFFAVHKVCQNPFILPSPPRYENVPEALSGAPRADLLLLYRDKLFSDATLNAEGKSFPVHRSILSARSPVFRAMFEQDEMSEGRSGVVDIEDVCSETVDRMLVYLYGDSVVSVQQWEDTSALYYAADKYDIKPLKHKCVTRLKEGLTVDNACEVLALADRHSDDQLMKCIVDFIRQNEEVMSSEKWDNFENCNPLLAAKVLRKIYVKNRKK